MIGSPVISFGGGGGGVGDVTLIGEQTIVGTKTFEPDSDKPGIVLLGTNVTTANLITVDMNAQVTGAAVEIDNTGGNAGTVPLLIHGVSRGIQIDGGGGSFGSDGLIVIMASANINGIYMHGGTSSRDHIRIVAAVLTNGSGIDITADALTVGSLLNLSSNSASTASRNLVNITNDNSGASGAIPLFVRQDSSSYVAHFQKVGAGSANVLITTNGSGNTISLDIDHNGATSAAIRIHGNTLTTSYGLTVPDADALTTGSILNLVSNSADVNPRNLVLIHNDNTLAGGADCLCLTQDADGGVAFTINSTSSSGHAIIIDSDSAIREIIQVRAASLTTSKMFTCNDLDALTTGIALEIISNSASDGARNLVSFVNDNISADFTTVLNIRQDANNAAMNVVSIGATATFQKINSGGYNVLINTDDNSISLNIDSEATTANIINTLANTLTTGYVLGSSNADALTTGGFLNLVSASASTATRTLGLMKNDDAAAVNATVLTLQQDAANEVMILDQTAAGSYIDFQGTVSGTATAPLTSLTGGNTIQGFAAIEINGTERWIPYYDAPTT